MTPLRAGGAPERLRSLREPLTVGLPPWGVGLVCIAGPERAPSVVETLIWLKNERAAACRRLFE